MNYGLVQIFPVKADIKKINDHFIKYVNDKIIYFIKGETKKDNKFVYCLILLTKSNYTSNITRMIKLWLNPCKLSGQYKLKSQIYKKSPMYIYTKLKKILNNMEQIIDNNMIQKKLILTNEYKILDYQNFPYMIRDFNIDFDDLENSIQNIIRELCLIGCNVINLIEKFDIIIKYIQYLHETLNYYD